MPTRGPPKGSKISTRVGGGDADASCGGPRIGSPKQAGLINDEASPSDAAAADLPPGPDELETAVRDVAYRLTHDLHDTGEDLRDAAAFAPLALAKGLNDLVTRAAAHPRKLALAVIAVATAVGLLGRRKRSPRR